ncbi:MAG TPA: tRNA (adenosine(37)-N6)-threonylcarbamoyltransferase complex dimerization subunit type 1 TsaB [Cyclobacteriaceae bacterium]|nr:tRNA (adenosine(37)-N6)-threonylcarbamoyltransferase complex dimerization subunit type 1 TsaB [Cyclobacteriaceae bacterium]
MILNIDTATETASIALSDGTQVLELMTNEDQRDHAAWIHNAIRAATDKAGCSLSQLRAFAVTAGPGSYTGLRVGMATAKGICYAMNIPLITESTLKVMARAAVEFLEENMFMDPGMKTQVKKDAMESATGYQSQADKGETIDSELLCPMIDARRMEVFAAVYTKSLKEVKKPEPVILDGNSFGDLLATNRVIFFGTGSKKFRDLIGNNNASFRDIRHHAGHLAFLSNASFRAGKFNNAAYADPVYLKEFYTHTRK